MLYVFTDCETYIEDFSVRYAKWIYPKDVQHKELQKIVTKEYFLTKLRKSFSQKEMVDDLLIKARKNTTQTIIQTPTRTRTDADGDGWTDAQERVIGTNPNYVDTFDGCLPFSMFFDKKQRTKVYPSFSGRMSEI